MKIKFPIIFFIAIIIFSNPFAQEKKKKGKEEKPKGYTSISINIPAVTLNVVVTDKHGNIITGLQKSNFKVYENNVSQKITNFFPDSAPINVVILMENSQIISGLEQDFWDAVSSFVRNLRQEDYCALVVYDIKPRIAVDFTLNKNKIINEVYTRLYFKGFRESALSDALIFVIERIRQVEGKKAIVLFSTGLDTFSKHTYSEALKIASSSDAAIYAVSMGQYIRLIKDQEYSSLTRAELLMSDLRLKSFAKNTGGFAFFPRFFGEYPSIFKNINMYLRYQYTIAYTPKNQKLDGKRRKIKVEAFADINKDGKPDKLVVHHKKSYKAPKKR